MASITLVQFAYVVTYAVTRHSLRLGSALLVVLGEWLTFRQWQTKKR
jgi:hypothetical protein